MNCEASFTSMMTTRKIAATLLLGCVLSGELSSLLACPFCLAFLLLKTAGFGGLLQIRGTLGLRLTLQTRLLFLNRLLHALARFLSRLRTRLRKIAVLGSVQIRPGIKCCHILRSIVLVVQRPSISHRSPQNFPAVNSPLACAQYEWAGFCVAEEVYGVNLKKR